MVMFSCLSQNSTGGRTLVKLSYKLDSPGVILRLYRHVPTTNADLWLAEKYLSLLIFSRQVYFMKHIFQ